MSCGTVWSAVRFLPVVAGRGCVALLSVCRRHLLRPACVPAVRRPARKPRRFGAIRPGASPVCPASMLSTADRPPILSGRSESGRFSAHSGSFFLRAALRRSLLRRSASLVPSSSALPSPALRSPAAGARGVTPRDARGSRRFRFRAVSACGDPRRRLRGSDAAPRA